MQNKAGFFLNPALFLGNDLELLDKQYGKVLYL